MACAALAIALAGLLAPVEAMVVGMMARRRPGFGRGLDSGPCQAFGWVAAFISLVAPAWAFWTAAARAAGSTFWDAVVPLQPARSVVRTATATTASRVSRSRDMTRASVLGEGVGDGREPDRTMG
ncbi:hypothetical protein GCM10023215_20260 [Pseudonocardia yuanmonensis]|uniref:DUF4190 domain-containing protein n=1 Tax=Pseudonocardia yuanmonensis TaxID=1095914 RepID=A0ABP8WA27_9PSEU